MILLAPMLAMSPDPPCQSRSDRQGACFTVHGSLRLFDGTPSARIRIAGSKRILGVVPFTADGNETFSAPRDVIRAASFDHSLTGNYLVCPVSAPKPNEMRLVCIASATLPRHSKK